MQAQIKLITNKLLDDSLSNNELSAVLKEYKMLLLHATNLDLNLTDYKVNMQLEYGVAIGLSWAASCLDDTVRTKRFLRGTKLAIEQKLAGGKKTIQLLYAGTGPFATLILPLLSYYSAEELNVTLLDINPRSIENVSKLIEHFGFVNHVSEIRCADATKTTFENASFDILLTETMQHALQKELQLVISSHLLNQMSTDAILIPQSIDLNLVKMNSADDQNELEKMDDLMKVDSDFLRVESPIQSDWMYQRRIELKGLSDSDEGFIAISTAIEVFENERIEWNESGLTSPKIIASIQEVIRKGSIELKYVIDPEPGFEIQM